MYIYVHIRLHTHMCTYSYIHIFMLTFTYTAQCFETNATASEMDEELLRLVHGYHVSAHGLKILDDVGVVFASDFMHISDSDFARCGMNKEDLEKVGAIREDLSTSNVIHTYDDLMSRFTHTKNS